MKIDEVEDTLLASQGALSLESPAGQDEDDSAPLGDLVTADRDGDELLESASQKFVNQALYAAMKDLTLTERRILLLHNGDKPLTYAEISEVVPGVTSMQNASQIHDRALRKLQTNARLVASVSGN